MSKLFFVYCVCLRSVAKLCFFATSWTVACQAPLSIGFSKQEYWSGLPFPPPGHIPYPGIEPVSPAWQFSPVVNDPLAMQENAGWIPGPERSPGQGHGNPLQYSYLENPMDREPGRLQSIASQRVRHH